MTPIHYLYSSGTLDRIAERYAKGKNRTVDYWTLSVDDNPLKVSLRVIYKRGAGEPFETAEIPLPVVASTLPPLPVAKTSFTKQVFPPPVLPSGEKEWAPGETVSEPLPQEEAKEVFGEIESAKAPPSIIGSFFNRLTGRNEELLEAVTIPESPLAVFTTHHDE